MRRAQNERRGHRNVRCLPAKRDWTALGYRREEGTRTAWITPTPAALQAERSTPHARLRGTPDPPAARPQPSGRDVSPDQCQAVPPPAAPKPEPLASTVAAR